jgi:1-acyl-sn-glycerol-3-phosphate acyltransferase
MADSPLAKMKAQVYFDPRPAEFFDKYHERARRRGPDWVYELLRIPMMAMGLLLFRTRAIDADNVPKSGPVILAPNHFSYMDHFFLGLYIRRKLRFMAKSQLFKWPLSVIYKHGGVFPVRRGARDDQAFVTARAILDNGGCVAMYCEGGRSRTGKLAARAKPGIGRLALESGAMIVPVAIHGSSHVRNWKRLRFPKITVQYGEPFRYPQVETPSREQRQESSDAIFDEIKALYAELDELGRKGVVRRRRSVRRGVPGVTG